MVKMAADTAYAACVRGAEETKEEGGGKVGYINETAYKNKAKCVNCTNVPRELHRTHQLPF